MLGLGLGPGEALRALGAGGWGEGPPKKTKKKSTKKQIGEKRPTDFSFFFFFLGAPFKRYAGRLWSVDMPPQMGTRGWLRGLPLRASSLW
jgi:hypothetical protein